MKLLKIDSSARRSSVSRQLTATFVETWKKENPAGEVLERDLSTTLLPHITDDWSATYGDPSKLTPAQQQYLSTSDALIEELAGADTIVVGSPMYNFTISWELKAWIDQVVRVGKTMTYGATAPKGCWVERKLWSSRRAVAPIQRIRPARSSIFRSPTCAASWVLWDLPT